MNKRRVTVTVDEVLLGAALKAVEDGRAESVSAWINDSISEHVQREHRAVVMRQMLAEYEAEHGEITDEEIAKQSQADRDAAAHLRQRARAVSTKRAV
jgi:hypothetical protein